MNICITGVSGFVGSNLSSYLKENGFNITALSLRAPSTSFVFQDNIKTIIHLAGKAHDTSGVIDEGEYFSVNRDLTIKLFESFLSSAARDFFYFSSVKAAKDHFDGVLTEDVSPTPTTPYGKSKCEAEIYLTSRRLPENKRLFIIRPCMIHGPGNKGNLNMLYNIVKSGIPWPLTQFENRRSFLTIANLNYLLHMMIESPNVSSGIYNFSDDMPLSTNELIQIISRSLNKKTLFLKMNKTLVKGIARLGDIFNLPLNSERLTKLTESFVVSNDKIKTSLAIEKLPVTSKDGIILTIESFNK